MQFVYNPSPCRVGPGSFDRLKEEAERLAARRALLLCTPVQVRLVADAKEKLGPLAAGVYARAVMHVPIETARERPLKRSGSGQNARSPLAAPGRPGRDQDPLGKRISRESGRESSMKGVRGCSDCREPGDGRCR